MHTRGADLVIEDLEIDAPHAGEVAVRLVATGVCHSDLNGLRGSRPLPLPMVLGHEGAGVVEAVGAGVTSVAVGDHVVLAAIARCGKCQKCVAGKPWLCSVAGANLFTGTLFDGTTRLKLDGRPVYHWFSQSSFAERAVVPEGAAVKVRRDVSLQKIATLACGVSTGLGAVLNAARVEPGASVVVIGCGGVGVSAVVGADLAQAGTIVAVDIADDKLEFARSLGATHAVNAKTTDPVEAIRALTGGGAEHVFDCVGSPTTLTQLVQMIGVDGHGWLIGAPTPGASFSFPTDGFLRNKSFHGVTLGSVRPSIDIPRYVELYVKGRLPLDRLVTRAYGLDRINEAFGALETTVGRGVVVFG
jgi:S-(hydroxymethyl)glutathione dehydrogenase / alcohol dehydrogenase